MTAFTLSPTLKKLMHFGNVKVKENSRAGGLKKVFCKFTTFVFRYTKLSPECLRPTDFKTTLKIFSTKVDVWVKLTQCVLRALKYTHQRIRTYSLNISFLFQSFLYKKEKNTNSVIQHSHESFEFGTADSPTFLKFLDER